jgi:hypothetical protein
MSVDPRTVSPPSRPRRRWLLWTALGFVVAVAGSLLVYWLIGTSRLEQARAEADRLDPGWRWDDIQASRRTFSDDENGALTVERIAALLPSGWNTQLERQPLPVGESADGGLSVIEQLNQLSPNQTPGDAVRAALHDMMVRTEEARRAARRLEQQPRGRPVLPPDFDYMNNLAPLVQESRTVSSFLGLAAQFEAAEGNLDEALLLNLCQLHASGALGDEPTLIAMLVRTAIDAAAAVQLERILGQGEASPAILERLQKAYAEGLAEPRLLIALRGERAGMDRYEYMRNVAIPGGLPTAVQTMAPPGWYDSNYATVLEQLTQAVEIAKKSPGEQRREYAEWLAEIQRMRSSRLRRLLQMHALLVLPAVEKVASTEHRRQAMLGCAVLALAAERYRLQHGRWPERVEDLEPFVGAIPADPYVEGSLKLRRTPFGLVIYSVGPDEVDNGGNLDRQNSLKKGIDYGFQLWDPDKGRQVVRPVAPATGPMP